MTNRPNPSESDSHGGGLREAEEKKFETLCLLSIFGKSRMISDSSSPEEGDNRCGPSPSVPDFFDCLVQPTQRVARAAEKAARSGDKLSPALIAAPSAGMSQNEAELLLHDSIKDLSLTTDGSLPRLAKFEPSLELKEKTTVRGLAEARLGPKASDGQIKVFIEELVRANPDLELENGDDELEAGQRLMVPGQDRTGGIYLEGHKLITTTWANGSSRDETSEGVQIHAKGSDRETVFFISESGNPPSNKTVIKGKVAIHLRADGLEIVTNLGKDGETPRVHQVRRPDKSEFTMSYEKDSDQPKTVTHKKAGIAPTKYERTNTDEYVSKDRTKGLVIAEDSSILLYRRQVNRDGTITRSFENNDRSKCDKDGNLIYHLTRPHSGLKIERFFKPKDETPYRTVIEHDDLNKDLGRKGPLELSQTPARRLVATINGPDGLKRGTVELSKEDTVSYLEAGARKSTHWILDDRPDKKMTVSTKPTGDHEIQSEIVFGDGGKISRLHDRFKIKKAESYTEPSGAKWTREFNLDGKPKSLKVTAKDLEIDLTFNREMRMFKGTIKEGGTIKDATLCRDTLFIRGKDGKLEARSLEWDNGSTPQLQKGRYDIERATFTREETADGRTTQIRTSLIPGITERIKGSTMEGTMINGVKSTINFMGEAIVERPDGNAVRLGRDNRVDVWDETGKSSVRGEALSREVIDYLKKYPDTDRRLIAEIHRRFRSEPESRTKSDNMFKKLGDIENIKGLTADQRQALRHSILTHVAFPEAITQGDPTFVCGGATMQRQLAITHPDKYASTLVSALSGSPLKNIDGKDVRFNQTNLLMHDTTGRDIASRAFQTLVMSLAHSKLRFENTSTGVGRLIDVEGRSRSFSGLGMDRMAMVLSSLTETSKAVVTVNSPSELKKLFTENQNKSMALLSTPKGTDLSHVYNLVGIEDGPPLKLRIQDHGGLTEDKSHPNTALMDLSEVFGDKGEATVIFGGKERLDPKKVYTVENDKIIVDEKRSREFAEEREREED